MTQADAHVVAVPGGSWTLWRCAALRSAGFPADDVLSFASAATAATADALLQCEAEDDTRRASLLAQLRHAHQAARTRGDEQAARALAGARRHVQAGRLPGRLDVPELEAARRTLLRSGTVRARCAFEASFADARARTSSVLRATAAGSRFREAVIWQNHAALHTCLEPLLRAEPGTSTSKHRQHEELVASYAHRYCVKNETIGFFGPVGWATIADDGASLDVRAGARVVRSRSVYFEQWAIDAFADSLAADPMRRSDLIVRPSPQTHIDGRTVHRPLGAPLRLTLAEMLVFRSCDGVRTSRQVAKMLRLAPGGAAFTDAVVDAIIERLRGRRLVSLDYELPLDAHAERRLRERLERIDDGDARRRALGGLALLEADRDAVAASAGNPEALSRALHELDTRFTSLTGSSSSRSPGAMYTGRTLLYEDCLRDVTMRIGASLVADLGPPLSLVLESARWLTYEVGRRTSATFASIHEALALRSQTDRVDFVRFYHRALAALQRDTAIIVLGEELRQRWKALLAPAPGARIARYRAAELEAGTRRVFDAPGPGWPGACYHSPDVMIAGTSLEAINAGDRLFVLGELHIGANTLRGQLFVQQHADEAALLRDIDADLPGLRLAPLTPRRYSRRATRLFPVLTSPNQYLVAMTLDSVSPPGARVIPASSLVVRAGADGLVIETRNGALRFDLLQAFAGVLARIVIDRFGVFAGEPHTPRVLFDDLVVARETWRFPCSALPFADDAEPAQRFLATRRWRAQHEMPRWVFVRIPGELKPIYVDFDSPIAVDILARRVRKAASSPQRDLCVSVTEMLPHHGQHWLRDAEGQRYCCELRLIAVDRGSRPATPAQPPHACDDRVLECS